MDQNNDLVKDGAKVRLVVKDFAVMFNLDEPSVIPMVLQRSFAFADPTPCMADVMAFMMAAVKYQLNPFMQEIFALKNSFGQWQPVVGVDGWSNIINRQENMGSLRFNYSPVTITTGGSQVCADWIECEIHLKDFHLPTVVREYLVGNYRDTIYWNGNTPRMLRHRALIQCARLAFSLSGISDADEVREYLKLAAAGPTVKAGTPLKVVAAVNDKKGPLTGGLRLAKEAAAKGEAISTKTESVERENNGELLFV